MTTEKYFFKERKRLYYLNHIEYNGATMKKLILCLLLAGLTGCRPSFTDRVNRETVTFADSRARRYTADVLTAKKFKPEAAVILLCSSQAERQQWQETAAAMAAQNYLMVSGPLPSGTTAGDGLDALQAGRAWLKTKYPTLKVGIIGWEQSALACLQIGGADSTIAAAVLITPTANMEQLDSTRIKSWAGRALLMIVAEQDPHWALEKAQRFYDALPDNKKLVQLATANRGGQLLQTDMEPIVRRTTVLLFDRYLKGKN